LADARQTLVYRYLFVRKLSRLPVKRTMDSQQPLIASIL
jgi:hypothetical protein